MSSPAASLAAMKPRPYRRYLTTALHSRFVRAALLALLNGMVVSSCTGKDYFWSWFPLGPAGFKAALFSMSSVFIFILQLATLSVGSEIAPSPFSRLRTSIASFSTYQTIFWYLVSAWWFCEIFIWSVPEHRRLGWITRGDDATPDRLNERPIYFRFFFSVLALVQAGIHLYCNQSYLHIPVSGPVTPQDTDQRTHPINSTSLQLQRKGPCIVKHAAISSACASLIAPFVYKAFFRQLFWDIHLAFAKPFFNLPRSDAHPPDTYFIGTIIFTAFGVGLLLSITWEISALSFLTCLKQEPLKNGLPLSGASKDPNGTLLSGLTAKRDVVQTFAFWELSIIAQKFPDRRVAVFADFERSKGPMWTSIFAAALNVISSIDDRIISSISPGSAPAGQPPSQQEEITSLPKITKGASQQSILVPTSSPASLKLKAAALAREAPRYIGQPQNPWHPPIEQTKQQLIGYTTSTAGQNADKATKWLDTFCLGPLRGFLQMPVASKLKSDVLGTPTGNASVIVDAIESITKMLVASLNEDNYGKAVQTVPSAVKQFTKTIQLIESQLHNNFQSFTSEDERELEEIVIIVSRLKSGLCELLSAFQVFLNDAGLSIRDLNEAKRAAGHRPLFPEKRQPSPSTMSAASEENNDRQSSKRDQMEMEQVNNDDSRRRRDASSKGGVERRRDSQDDKTKQSRRAEERRPQRIEGSSLRRQQSAGGERGGNVFGARDFDSLNSGRRREVQQVR